MLRSAIANWEQKNERKAESGELFVTKIFVDGGATLKRMRPAPQGRGYRIRKTFKPRKRCSLVLKVITKIKIKVDGTKS